MWPKIELFKGKGSGKWYFHKKSRNGQISQPSQGYKHKSSAKKAAWRDIPEAKIMVEIEGNFPGDRY